MYCLKVPSASIKINSDTKCVHVQVSLSYYTNGHVCINRIVKHQLIITRSTTYYLITCLKASIPHVE